MALAFDHAMILGEASATSLREVIIRPPSLLDWALRGGFPDPAPYHVVMLDLRFTAPAEPFTPVGNRRPRRRQRGKRHAR